MLLQLAAQDIGQLTDIESRRVFSSDHCPAPTAETPGRTAILRGPPGLYRQGQHAAGVRAGELGQPMTVSEDFTSLTGRFRGELLAHCYRMLGSAEEAEDLVQETYLRAWRSFDGFEGRSSVRTWLYRIATNVCLTAIERRGRRPLPSGLGGPAEDPQTQLVNALEVPWLQPLPDALLAREREDPAAATVSRTGIRLAFVAALQHLSARERAVLILRDVLGFPAAEAADLLGTTTTAVNSGLRRARAQLAQVQPAEDELAEPTDPARRALLDRFAAAFENADASALAELLREDVALEMPPLLTWFAGRPAVTRFMASRVFTRFRFRLVPVMTNGQPAFAAYTREGNGSYHAHEVLVPTLSKTGIARIVVFLNPDLFEMFGLPREYEEQT
jgi:RNA polymerase sigma-70 factor (ECF subfamily)